MNRENPDCLKRLKYTFLNSYTTVLGWLSGYYSVSASHTVGRGFASRPGHTKDHHKNGTNCLPAWHVMR